MSKSNCEIIMPKVGKMNVSAKIFASDKLFSFIKKDDTLNQLKNMASLPNVMDPVIALSDAHQGYGFPIGGVAAFEKSNGIISPGGVGFDINCGVRLLTSRLVLSDVLPKIQEVLDLVFERVPVGVGSESRLRLSPEEFDDMLLNGVGWAVKNGFASERDALFCEDNGCLPCDPGLVSLKAKKRGRRQLGTLGAGNHFIEFQYVDEIYDEKIASVFGITKKNQVLVMIHTGSRGLGHQVCSDYIKKMQDAYPVVYDSLIDKNLMYAPINSKLGSEYIKAMGCAANFAYVNRQVIAHRVRSVFKRLFSVNLDLLYDITHNIAKFEDHIVDGVKKRLLIHRKGATRAFPPGYNLNPAQFLETGHPVILPGSMGTASYVLVGTNFALTKTFASSAHGAGRLVSRHSAKQLFDSGKVVSELSKLNIFVKSASSNGIVEEAPLAYKDIDEVIESIECAGIARKIVKLRPFGVIKG